jgi:hypothetical protein
MLPFITADHFRLLLDGTGKPFAEFMDRVLRASAAKLGIAPAHVHTNLRVNLGDGGVDTQIDQANDPEGHLAGPTIWQFKGRRFADVTEADVREEILGSSKQYARDLILKGYAYRLCICEDADARAKLALQQKLNEFVRQVNPNAPAAIILLPSDIAAWANRFPSVVARYLGVPVEKFRWHDSWRPSARGETQVFVPTEHYAEWAARAEAYLDWSRKPGEVALTIYGDAGVGKTRSVFEILDQQTNQRELVVYTNDEQAAIEIATALTNDGVQNAILVADECLSRARFRLSDILRGNEHRVRLITIDNARERSRTLAAELQILGATEQETLRVLEANFDKVPMERRQRYTRIANGSLRFAVYMCTRDSEIQESGNLSSALRDARSYYESRFSGQFGFDAKDREALEIVALVDRVGYREDLASQLDALCALVGRDPQETRERIERIRTSTGFIASAGRFYYVTPAPVAMVAFESAWDRWAAGDTNRFLKGLPEDLVQPFQDRVASASPEVGAEVARFFREWTVANGARILASESDTRHLVALVVADPKTQVPLLRMLVESASVPQLQGEDSRRFPFTSGTPRRLLVSLAEELAQFGEFFADAEAILFRLALVETEPSIGNNATNTWKGLFRILLSGTEVPFVQRFEILKERCNAGDVPARELVVSAAAGAVDRQPIRMVGAPLFGSLVPPQDWRPKTYGEYYDAIQNSVNLLLDITRDSHEQVSAAAKKALFEAAGHLLWAGYVEPVRKALEGKVSEDLKPRISALVRESHSRLSRHGAETQNAEIKAALEDWLESLKSTTLHAKLVENVASEPWSHHFDEEEWRKRIDDLAKQLYADPAVFAAELGWLNSSEAKAGVEVGHFFGKLDAPNLRFLNRIIDAAIEHRADAFARGYVYGLTSPQPCDLSELNRAIDRVQKVDPKLAFFIMLPAGDFVRSFERALTMVSGGQIPTRLLSNLQVWVGNRKTMPQEAGQAVRALIPIAQSGDRDAIDAAVDFVAYQINREAAEEKANLLTQIFGEKLEDLWTLLELFAAHPAREDFWFAKVLQVAIEVDVARGCEVASQMIVSDSFPLKQEGEQLLAALVQTYPEQTMEAIGRRMTDGATMNQFFIRKFSFVAAIPLDVAKTWLERVGVVGARAFARHLQPPYLDGAGQPQVPQLTEFILTRFEDDDRTFSEFVAGVHSYQGYWGSFSEAREKEGLQAKPFLTHRLRRIREWALIEMRQAEHDARVHGIREDEFGLR